MKKFITNYLRDRSSLIYSLLSLSTFLFLLGDDVASKILIMLTILVWLLDPKIINKIKICLSNHFFWLFISFFLLTAIGLLYSENSGGDKFLTARLLIIALPLITFSTPVSRKFRELYLSSFLAGTLVGLFIGLSYSFYLFFQTGDTGYFYNDNLTLAINIQAAYYAIFVNISVVIAIYLFHKKLFNWRLLGSLLVALTVFQFLLATRISILTTGILLISYAIYLVKNKGKKNLIIIISVGVIVILVSFFAFPQTVNRFKSMFSNLEYRYDNPNPVNHFNGEIKEDNWNGLNLRLALWSIGWDIIEEYPLLGVGTGDYGPAFDIRKEEVNFIYAQKMKFGVHNQYLYTWISFGIIGLLIFLISLLYPSFLAFKSNNYVFVAIVFIFILAFMTENVLNRFWGVYIYSFLLSITFNWQLD